ncbi:hypothetical protein XELAEV_18005566mg [Xenopus laevis]|uniref:Uncharacterized protein n=1 Tax=Xenopus laevis TaxID=8355 RepID=A0A974I389_XENLA|nr:hypothetical protein XELAEV_18005566mg [Xenopus laevis]
MGHLNSTSDAPFHPLLFHQQNSFKPLGRPCIPFHSIPHTANVGVCRLPGSNGMERNAAFIVWLKCAHVYAAIFLSLSHPFTAVPYLTTGAPIFY